VGWSQKRSKQLKSKKLTETLTFVQSSNYGGLLGLSWDGTDLLNEIGQVAETKELAPQLGRPPG